LILEHDPQIAFIGSADDSPRIDAILEGRPWPGVLDLSGRLSIEELAALLERSDLLIGSDSGPAHLAAAVGTPVVALFSGTNHAAQWRPWGERVRTLRHETACSPCHRHRCPLTDHPCLSGLLPCTVLAAASEWLDKPVESIADRPRLPLVERTPT
jgi:ADP-heptose:LPS heptosyltransferase